MKDKTKMRLLDDYLRDFAKNDDHESFKKLFERFGFDRTTDEEDNYYTFYGQDDGPIYKKHLCISLRYIARYKSVKSFKYFADTNRFDIKSIRDYIHTIINIVYPVDKSDEDLKIQMANSLFILSMLFDHYYEIVKTMDTMNLYYLLCHFQKYFICTNNSACYVLHSIQVHKFFSKVANIILSKTKDGKIVFKTREYQSDETYIEDVVTEDINNDLCLFCEKQFAQNLYHDIDGFNENVQKFFDIYQLGEIQKYVVQCYNLIDYSNIESDNVMNTCKWAEEQIRRKQMIIEYFDNVLIVSKDIIEFILNPYIL